MRNSILATLAYYDIFDYPLTLPEIHSNLINPSRIMMTKTGLGEIDINNISQELKKLEAAGLVGRKEGFYFLDSRADIYEARIQSQNIAYQKWKKFAKTVKFLALAPFLKGVFASGSLAMSNTDEKSDFDVLVIVQSGRLYTCRIFLWLITSVLRSRRKKDEKIAPDKLCFNHYITTDRLEIRHESLFNAQTYANLKPALIETDLVNEFYNANLWLNNYLYNFSPPGTGSNENKLSKVLDGINVKPPRLFKSVAGTIELVLNNKPGDWLEKFVKKIQQNKIRKNPVTYESGGRIVFTDVELEFHPRSFEKVVLEKYNHNLNKLGIIPYIKEKDSGLLS